MRLLNYHATAEGAGAGVAADASAVYYNVQGLRADSPVKGQLLIQMKGNKASNILR